MKSRPSSGTWKTLGVLMGLTVICFSGQLSRSGLVSADPSLSLRGLAAILSGNFTNEEQVQKEIDNGQPPGPLANIMYYPLNMSLFDEGNETFYEQHINNGQITYRQMVVLGENDEGVMRLKFFKPLIPLPDSLWSFNISKLEALTMDDLEYMEDCDATIYKIDKVNYFGTFPECTFLQPESNISYPNLLTCQGIYIQVPTVIGDLVNLTEGQLLYTFKPLDRYKLRTYPYEGAGKKELCPGKYT